MFIKFKYNDKSRKIKRDIQNVEELKQAAIDIFGENTVYCDILYEDEDMELVNIIDDEDLKLCFEEAKENDSKCIKIYLKLSSPTTKQARAAKDKAQDGSDVEDDLMQVEPAHDSAEDFKPLDDEDDTSDDTSSDTSSPEDFAGEHIDEIDVFDSFEDDKELIEEGGPRFDYPDSDEDKINKKKAKLEKKIEKKMNKLAKKRDKMINKLNKLERRQLEGIDTSSSSSDSSHSPQRRGGWWKKVKKAYKRGKFGKKFHKKRHGKCGRSRSHKRGHGHRHGHRHHGRHGHGHKHRHHGHRHRDGHHHGQGHRQGGGMPEFVKDIIETRKQHGHPMKKFRDLNTEIRDELFKFKGSPELIGLAVDKFRDQFLELAKKAVEDVKAENTEKYDELIKKREEQAKKREEIAARRQERQEEMRQRKQEYREKKMALKAQKRALKEQKKEWKRQQKEVKRQERMTMKQKREAKKQQNDGKKVTPAQRARNQEIRKRVNILVQIFQDMKRPQIRKEVVKDLEEGKVVGATIARLQANQANNTAEPKEQAKAQ